MTRCFDLDNIITVLLKKIKKDDKKKVKKIYHIFSHRSSTCDYCSLWFCRRLAFRLLK